MANEQPEVTWNCRFHPTDWWHEVGCPHQAWTVDQLRDQIVTMKRGANIALDSYKTLTSQAVDTEREACAKLVESLFLHTSDGTYLILRAAAEAIRAIGAA
jgi:hypothetical protein